jgi:carboxymethylenebutenolidase
MSINRRVLLFGAVALPATSVGAQDLQQDAKMAVQRQSFTSGGRSIAVEVFDTGLPGRRPAVLMLHGADGLSSNTQYRSGARAMAAAGYRVLLVHYLERTGERRASFGTVFQNFLPWMETVRDAVAWAADRDDVNPERIGVVGISLGAALGLAVAGTEPRIKALVDYFGPLPQGVIVSGARLPPTLILHGGADPIVPVANAYAIESLLQEQGVAHEIKVYPGEGHGFYGAAQEDATARVLAFLRRYLPIDQAAADSAL